MSHKLRLWYFRVHKCFTTLLEVFFSISVPLEFLMSYVSCHTGDFSIIFKEHKKNKAIHLLILFVLIRWWRKKKLRMLLRTRLYLLESFVKTLWQALLRSWLCLCVLSVSYPILNPIRSKQGRISISGALKLLIQLSTLANFP